MTSEGLSLALAVTFIHLAISNVERSLLTTMDERERRKKTFSFDKKVNFNRSPVVYAN